MPYNSAVERPLPERRRIQPDILLAFKFKGTINVSRLIFFFTHPGLVREVTLSEYYKGLTVFPYIIPLGLSFITICYLQKIFCKPSRPILPSNWVDLVSTEIISVASILFFFEFASVKERLIVEGQGQIYENSIRSVEKKSP